MRRLLLLPLFAVLVRAAELKCAACHADEARAQQHSAMAHALAVDNANPLFRTHPLLQVRKGNFAYALETNATETTYSVTDGTNSISVPVHWSFGQENQTFVFDYKGQWYEGLVSYFHEIDGLDTTVGDLKLQPQTLLEALGRPIDEEERKDCFGCHSSNGIIGDKLDLSQTKPGVTCDHCHVNATLHQASVLKGSLAGLPPKLKAMTASETSEFCGQCHRTWETVMRMPSIGLSDVRFQPYRLSSSKCFTGGDPRISCLACHNPHGATLPSAETVTTKCVACHNLANRTKLCPVSKTDCASCHMPKVELPGGHKVFTDHDIRIVKPGEAYPY